MGWLQILVSSVIASLTPQIREDTVNWIKDMEAKAKETPNPVDDLFVGALKLIFGVT